MKVFNFYLIHIIIFIFYLIISIFLIKKLNVYYFFKHLNNKYLKKIYKLKEMYKLHILNSELQKQNSIDIKNKKRNRFFIEIYYYSSLKIFFHKNIPSLLREEIIFT